MKITLTRIYTCPTYTIGRLRIDNEYICDTCEDRDRGLDQSWTEAKIRKVKVYKQTAIPTGTYKVTLRVQSPKMSKVAYYKQLCNGYLPRLIEVPGYEGILIHCLTPDIEILTEHGWKDYETFKNEPESRCYSYNTDTGEVELTDIDNFIEQDYEGELYCCDGRVSYSVTDKHRMWVNVKKHGGDREWQWRTADDIPYGAKFVTAATKQVGWEISAHQKLLYRLIIAVQADGYILNWSNTASQVRFHFKKERKINRIKEILNELGDNYKTYIDSEGKTHIALSPKLSEYITEVMNPDRNVYNTKELPIELLSLKADDMRDLVMDYLFWDGRWENYLKCNKNMVISSVNKRTIDILQAMAFMSGFRVSSSNDGRVYDLKLYVNQETTMPDSPSYSVKDYKGKVWCISNKNHTIIVRKNGHVCVLGNCGNNASQSAGCILVGYNTVKGCVNNSKQAFEKVYARLKAASDKGEKITIEITRNYVV